MIKKRKSLLKNIAFYIFIFFIAITIIFFAINVLIEPQIKKNVALYSIIPKNLGERYKIFLSNFFSFNPGKIYSAELSSTQSNILILYLDRFKWSVLFSFLIFILSFILGNILGIISAYKSSKTFDIITSFIISFLAAIPILILVINALSNASIFGYPSQFILTNNKLSFISLLIPVLISSFPCIGIFFSKAKKKTLEILKSQYYLFAKSYGLNNRSLLKKVVLKNLLISELNLFFLVYVILFSITILVEIIFSIPGQSLFISFAFRKGEIDIIMFYFSFNFVLISIILLFNQFLIKKLNPILNESSIIKINKNKKLKRRNYE